MFFKKSKRIKDLEMLVAWLDNRLYNLYEQTESIKENKRIKDNFHILITTMRISILKYKK